MAISSARLSITAEFLGNLSCQWRCRFLLDTPQFVDSWASSVARRTVLGRLRAQARPVLTIERRLGLCACDSIGCCLRRSLGKRTVADRRFDHMFADE